MTVRTAAALQNPMLDKNGSKAGGLTMLADMQGSADLTHHDLVLM